MKKEIVERLLKDDHISFDEALELMGYNNAVEKIIIKEQQNVPYVYPWTYPYYPSQPFWTGSPLISTPSITSVTVPQNNNIVAHYNFNTSSFN